MSSNLSKIKSLLKEKRMDAALISSVPNIIYLTDFAGFSKEEREAYLLITKNRQYILTDGRYSEAVKAQIKDFQLIKISSKFPFEKALRNLVEKHKIKKMGFEGHNISFLEHKKLPSVFKNAKHFDINHVRATKGKQEILNIEKACKLGDKTFGHVLTRINAGVSEKQLAYEIEFFIKKAGGDISFPPIVAFGSNSAIPHHQTNDQRLTTKDKFVLLDFGVKLGNYCSDMTRTVFFGQPSAEQKRMHETVLEAQKKAIQQFNNLTIQQSEKGIKASEIDKTARNYIISKGYKTIPHSLGHGIGIEVHESPHLSPKSKDILKPGMVFTIEPGIYLPGFGGIRIEDVVVLEKSGLRILTKSSKKIIVL